MASNAANPEEEMNDQPSGRNGVSEKDNEDPVKESPLDLESLPAKRYHDQMASNAENPIEETSEPTSSASSGITDQVGDNDNEVLVKKVCSDQQSLPTKQYHDQMDSNAENPTEERSEQSAGNGITDKVVSDQDNRDVSAKKSPSYLQSLPTKENCDQMDSTTDENKQSSGSNRITDKVVSDEDNGDVSVKKSPLDLQSLPTKEYHNQMDSNAENPTDQRSEQGAGKNGVTDKVVSDEDNGHVSVKKSRLDLQSSPTKQYQDQMDSDAENLTDESEQSSDSDWITNVVVSDEDNGDVPVKKSRLDPRSSPTKRYHDQMDSDAENLTDESEQSSNSNWVSDEEVSDEGNGDIPDKNSHLDLQSSPTKEYHDQMDSSAQNPNDKSEQNSASNGKSDEAGDKDNGEVPAKKPRVDLQSLPARQYLNMTLVPILKKALTTLDKERPPNPVLHLVHYLIQNKAEYDLSTASGSSASNP